MRRALALPILAAGLAACAVSASSESHEAVDSSDLTESQGAVVSFTFDDGYASQLTLAAPILARHGFVGTDYVATGLLASAPDEWGSRYLTWPEVHTLGDQYGWEIGSHSVSHPPLTTVDETQLERELADSKAELVANGFDVTGFATPYGDYNDAVLRQAAKLYAYHRPFHDTDVLNSYPVDRSLLWVKQVQAGGGGAPSITVDDVKGWIDEAVREKAWLVLVFHEIREQSNAELATAAGSDGDVGVAWGYAFSATDLSAIADYVASKNVRVRTPQAMLAPRTKAKNLIANGGFAGGLAGFTTDRPARVITELDHGAWPSAEQSVALVGATQNAHLFGPKVPVQHTAYTLETYVDASRLTKGSVGFYVDEWDAAGNWVSGQYIRDVPDHQQRKVEHVAFEYTPGEHAVKASLQIILSPGATGTAFVDELGWVRGRTVY